MTGAELLKARQLTGLSREKVAARLDPPVSSKTIDRWERGQSPVKRWRLKQLAEVYGIELEVAA